MVTAACYRPAYTGFVAKRTRPTAPVDTLQDLNHLFLDRPVSEPLRKSIYGSTLSILDLCSRPWGVARQLSPRGVPWKGVGALPPPRLPRKPTVSCAAASHCRSKLCTISTCSFTVTVKCRGIVYGCIKNSYLSVSSHVLLLTCLWFNSSI